MKNDITQDFLKSIVNYDAETGAFSWVKRRGSARAGEIAGTPQNKGYIHILINRKPYLAHRLAWLYAFGKWPNDQIDHINGRKSDNRISNLREVCQQDNSRNRKKSKNNVTGVTGVYFHKKLKKFGSQIKVNYRHIHLGYFANFFDAVCARKSAEIRFNFHINHGRR